MNNLKLFIFVILLGGLTAGLIRGMDIITKDRIKNNKNYEWKAAMLDHHDLSTGVGIYTALFDETFTYENEELDPIDRVYRHKDLGTYSFFFTGNGLWGEINGVITLESDKLTILKITVLNQQETPGLGGVVSTRKYLNNYVGVKFDPNISLSKPDNTSDPETQVDQITGATGTSNRFITILNDVYLLKMGDQL